MTEEQLKVLEALSSNVVLRTGDTEVAVIPALIAEVRRLRALVEKSGVPHTITVNGEERLYWPLPKDATLGEP